MFLWLTQVLLLWDRLLGYDSLDLLPVLAAAVLVFRANLVMQVGFVTDEAGRGRGGGGRSGTVLFNPFGSAPTFLETTDFVG